MPKEEICCPKFNPEPWDEKEIEWKDKLFIQDSMFQFMHIPVFGFGKTVARMQNKIESAGAKVDDKEALMLSFDPSPWKSYLFINVTKEIPGAENVKISGKFLTKVFDGPFQNVPKWIKTMDEYVSSKDKKVKKYYFYYTTCPKCAKKYGHNYVVIFAEV